ncbi:hypothetical protein [Brumimicrobium aurantiacum]|uniref:Uncharacterized protein n=1 Tax=Brumimicrobium aurantiacum TaxID=1737063 RepID=A0A3E1F0J9_9FLAO|nr:hypothetical protein [Brumimicrobium aurantiacum]RFC55330.1 hypothetical protein DXU93_05775 [Brumimicrobium aurantiacum]
MGSNVIKYQIKYHIGIIFLSFLCINNAIAQDIKPDDSFLCVVYFADGFDNDTLQLKIGDKTIFNEIIVKSNMYYGLTGVEVWITDNYELLLIKNKVGDEKNLVERNSEFKEFLSQNSLVITIEDNMGEYSHYTDINEINYIVIYRKWCNIFFSEFLEQPSF